LKPPPFQIFHLGIHILSAFLIHDSSKLYMLIFWLVLVGNMTRLFNVLPTVHVVYRANLKAIGPALKVPHVGVIYFSLFKYTQRTACFTENIIGLHTS